MAVNSLVATRLQNWRVENPELDKNMARICEYGALDFFTEQTNSANSIVNDELKQKAFSSIGSTIQVPVLEFDKNVQVSNMRTCVIADNENKSALYTVVWKTYQVGFTMVPAAYHNNEIGYNRDFSRKMNKITRALANALDVDSVAALEANKTQVFKTKLNYNQIGNDIQVPVQMASEIMGDIDPMMRANCFTGKLHIIGNAGIESLMRKDGQFGAGNAIDKSIEWLGKSFHYTNNVVDESLKMGTFYAVEDGNVAVLSRVDREALRSASAQGHEWGVTRIPLVNLPVGYHYYTAVGDQSQIAGEATADLVCGIKEYYGFSVDVAYIVAYNSDPTTIANPIIKAELAKRADNVPFAAQAVYVTNAAEFQP